MAVIRQNKIHSRIIICTAFICALAVYSGIIEPSERHPFVSLLPVDQITELSVHIESNPVICMQGRYYKADCSVTRAASDTLKSDAAGMVTVYFPRQIIESFYPQKLYTQHPVVTGTVPLVETGLSLEVKGHFSEKGIAQHREKPSFYADSAGAGFWPDTFAGKTAALRALSRLLFKRILASWGCAGGLLLALLSGSREFTGDNLTVLFTRAGLAHILALSGMHLSFFSGIASFIGRKAGGFRAAGVLQTAAVVIFVWFAGLSPSLTRALICSLILSVSRFCRIPEPDMETALSLAFLIQGILFPQDLMQTAFILSYGALTGILFFSKYLEPFSTSVFPAKAAVPLAASVSAQILTAPAGIMFFGTFSPVGIAATCFVSPLISIFMAAGLTATVVSLCIPFLAPASGAIMGMLYNCIRWEVRLFSYVPPIKFS